MGRGGGIGLGGHQQPYGERGGIGLGGHQQPYGERGGGGGGGGAVTCLASGILWLH